MKTARAGRTRSGVFLIGCLMLGIFLPTLTQAAPKKQHPKEAVGQECTECHAAQETVWLEGKHGLMGVKCVVCHGSPEKNFAPKPALARCRGCHSDQVRDVEKARNPKERNCFRCHDRHSVAASEAAIKQHSGFHRQGGAQ